ncbi:MAG TPA: PEGA domain-containing protein [Chloroflexota bacterium]|jgi:hypothetical protein
MQLPVVLIVEGPTRADLAVALSGWRGRLAGALLIALLGAAAGAAAWWLTRPDGAIPEAGGVPLRITSAPTGATVLVDGRAHGRTP